MNKATVIIPTTGSMDVSKAIDSVLSQTVDTDCYVVCDGLKFYTEIVSIVLNKGYDKNKNFKFCCISENVGANGFYGHRIYAAFTHLINTEYVLYLDQDNWIADDHVETCLNKIEKNKLDWVYSLRQIHNKDGDFVCNDDCESLGKYRPLFDYNHIDTNCYCIKRKAAVAISTAFHGGWGQDRIFYQNLAKYFPNYDCSGKYTTRYRLNGNEGSVKELFFIHNNEKVSKLYNGVLPWQKI